MTRSAARSASRSPARRAFKRVAGFAGLRKGLTRIEATVKRSHGRWVATHVERSGGGGSHGGDDQGADDHGSGGHGADD